MSPIIECVPNFSEGRNMATIESITTAIQKVQHVKLLHVDVGVAANRTVMTFAGSPEAVVKAAFHAIRVASERIDMRQHEGEHPRIGATDVCPLVPVQGIRLEEVVPYSISLAEQVGNALNIPVYLYEASARLPIRKNLAHIRKGEYEHLAKKMQKKDWQPDFGPTSFQARVGATVIGARPFLIAYNVNLATTDVAIANRIAQQIRGTGKYSVINQQKVRIPGQFSSVKAIGWYIKEYQQAQVSMNLTDFSLTGLHEVFEACKLAANQLNVDVTGSELIGLLPLEALLQAGKFYAKPHQTTEKEWIDCAIYGLGLNDIEPFQANDRILEYLL